VSLEPLKNIGLPQGGHSDSFRINAMVFFIKVIIAVPFRNNKFIIAKLLEIRLLCDLKDHCAEKKREKDLKAKRQMRKAKNTDKIASHHLAIFCIFKQITYYF
jgi:hypothetical protein